MDVKYTTLDPLSNWQDITKLLKQYEPSPKSISYRPQQPDVLNITTSRIIEPPPKLFCCHGDLLTKFDSPWFSFLYAIAQGKILHEPPHALESLGPLMRQTDFIIRVESPFIVVFLVQSLDKDGGIVFVEIDRQSRWGFDKDLPEWLQGIFAAATGGLLEWKCRNHDKSFRCTVFLRKAVGLAWW